MSSCSKCEFYCATDIIRKKNSDKKWKIGDEEMEEVESFKYLGVWFEQRTRGNVQLEKMVK